MSNYRSTTYVESCHVRTGDAPSRTGWHRDYEHHPIASSITDLTSEKLPAVAVAGRLEDISSGRFESIPGGGFESVTDGRFESISGGGFGSLGVAGFEWNMQLVFFVICGFLITSLLMDAACWDKARCCPTCLRLGCPPGKRRERGDPAVLPGALRPQRA